jgi:hypothetical protein
MTKSKLNALIDAKLKVIKLNETNEYLEKAIARDACYSSHNAVTWKSGQMADIAAEIRSKLAEDGPEVVSVAIENLAARHGAMEEELHDLDLRHKADLAVYTEITQGEIWTPRQRRVAKVNRDSLLKKFG